MIVYVDSSGRTFDPPLQAIYEADSGFLSDPAAPDIFDHAWWDEQSSTIQYHCEALRRGVNNYGTNGFPAPARESHPEHEEGDRKRWWAGNVRIRFPEPG
jgi:hypothetical protein